MEIAMETRPYFVFGDILANSVAGVLVGVAMGARGSDAALEQADVVLMQDKLENFNFAYELSCRARRIIRQNLAISLGVIVMLVIGALGASVPLTLGVIGHEGSTLIVVFNSLRLLFIRDDAAKEQSTPGPFRERSSPNGERRERSGSPPRS